MCSNAAARGSGVSFEDRLRSAGFCEDPGGEVLANITGREAITSPAGFLNSVYHRALFLRSELTSFGYGRVGACATIDSGATPSAPTCGHPLLRA